MASSTAGETSVADRRSRSRSPRADTSAADRPARSESPQYVLQPVQPFTTLILVTEKCCQVCCTTPEDLYHLDIDYTHTYSIGPILNPNLPLGGGPTSDPSDERKLTIAMLKTSNHGGLTDVKSTRMDTLFWNPLTIIVCIVTWFANNLPWKLGGK